MGSGQSVRSSHFQNENEIEREIDDESHRISISNKMVERLVEDATVAGSAAAALSLPPTKPKDYELYADNRDRVLAEKLKTLDDHHSEKIGLTIENLKATMKRIEVRAANMMSLDPVCQECSEQLIECYNSCEDSNPAKCSELVTSFAKCVQETAVRRLRQRTAQDARDAARLTRHVVRARQQALKDISVPPQEVQ